MGNVEMAVIAVSCVTVSVVLTRLAHRSVRRAQARSDARWQDARRALAREAVRHRRRNRTELEFDEFGRQKCKPPEGAGE